MAALTIGLVYDLLGSYPRRPGDPLDYAYLRGREGDDIVVETFDGHLWRPPW